MHTRRLAPLVVVVVTVVGWILGCSGVEQPAGTPPAEVPEAAPAEVADQAPAEEAEAEAPAEGEEGQEEEEAEAEEPAPAEGEPGADEGGGAPVSEACGKPAQEVVKSAPPKVCTHTKVGQVFSFTCPKWDPKVAGWMRISGTGPFPVNSSVCYAAVYAGRLVPTDGGVVKIEILPARDVYPQGPTKNGVQSALREEKLAGFQFVD